MEQFAIPGAGAIIEQNIDGSDFILVQDRFKEGAKYEEGLVEITAGKIREFENIFDCIKREVFEETGLEITFIEGEKEAVIFEGNGYKVLSYSPFSSSQNLKGSYPIMVQTFICQAKGELLKNTNETKNMRWISLKELQDLLIKNPLSFYPMHVETLKKYLKYKNSGK